MAVEDLKEGSNLFDNVEGKVTNVQFNHTPPEGYVVEGNPIFGWVYLLLAGDAPEEERKVNQSYSLGASSGENFTPSEDGFGLVPLNDDAAVRKDSKWGTFVSALQNEGLPVPILKAGDWSKVIGLNGKWKRIADKERTFAEDNKRGGKKSKFPPSTLVCIKILAMPGGVAAGTVKPAGAAAPVANTNGTAATSATPAEFDLDTATADFLGKVIAKQGGKVQRSKLTLLLSQASQGNENRYEIAKRGAEESFLISMAEMGVFKYDATAKPQTVYAADSQ